MREALEPEYEVVEVEVLHGLHLKSAVTLLDERTVMVDTRQIDVQSFRQAGLRIVEVEEKEGANVLALGGEGRVVIMSSVAKKTIQKVRQLGFHVTELELSEFHKADGALTCLSLRVPKEGSWCV